MNKAQLPINLDLDMNEIRKEAQDKLKKHAKNVIDQRMDILFFNPRDQGSLNFKSRLFVTDPDLSLCHKQIDGYITDKVMSPEFEQYAKEYIEKHFQEILNNALDEAMDHKARAIAFKQVGLHAPRQIE